MFVKEETDSINLINFQSGYQLRPKKWGILKMLMIILPIST